MSNQENNSGTPVLNQEDERRENLMSNLSGLTVSPKPEEVTPSKEKKKNRFARKLEESKTNEEVERPLGSAPAQIHGENQNPFAEQKPRENSNVGSGGERVLMSGKIVGANANEPNWSPQEKQMFAQICSTNLQSISISESRKTKEDPRGHYVVKRPDGSATATSNAMLPTLTPKEFMLGIGSAKPDEKLPKKRMYSDIVIVGIDRDWVLTQWISKDVIMEPVPSNIRHKQHQPKNRQADRTIGVNFARFGLPVKSFGAVFTSLNATMPGLIDSLVVTDGYYWVNASWGVSTTPGTFAYMTDNKSIGKTSQLSEAMDMIGTKSSCGLGTFAISVACDFEYKNEKPIPNPTKYSFSIKCHNFFHIKKTDWHGPPQTTAVGFMASDDILSGAESLSKPAISENILGNTSSLFSNGGVNPFATNNAPPGEFAEKTTGGTLL